MVAEFDRQYMMLRLDDYRASLVQAEASVKKLKTDLDVQRKSHDLDVAKAKAARDKAALDLKTAPVLSAIAAEDARLALADAENAYKEKVGEVKLLEESLASQIRNAELELQQMQLEFKRAEANAGRMIVRAPIDGLAVMQTIPRGGELGQVQKGDQLWPGMNFISVVDPRSMVVNANANQADVEQLRLGLKATVRFDAYPDLVLPAHVYSIGGLPKAGGQRESYVKSIPVRLKLDALDPRVIPDLSVSADVVIETEPQGVVAPLGAVFRDAPSPAYVYVQQAAGWDRRRVELGVASNIAVAVREGLKPGEVVALDRPTVVTGN